MRATIEMSAVYGDRSRGDLRVMCGPKYNAFVPAEERRDEPGQFFQRAAWKAMSKPLRSDEDTERWDGLE